MPRRCSECGQEIVRRKDAQTCSPACRVKRYRRLKRGASGGARTGTTESAT